jgi:hypothetical protein
MAKLTDEQKFELALTRAHNKARKAAAAENSARLDEAGPLFANQVELVAPVPVDSRTMFWRGRFAISRAQEHLESVIGPCIRALDWLRVFRREKQAFALLAPDVFAAVKARCDSHRLEGRGPEYPLDILYQALKGFPEIRAEMDAEIGRFNQKPYQPDDGGLAQRLFGAKS